MAHLYYTKKRYNEALDLMLARLAGCNGEVLVAESGASPLEPYNGAAVVERLSANVRFTVLCAYDPNTKAVSPTGTVTTDQELVYTIFFENTGATAAERAERAEQRGLPHWPGATHDRGTYRGAEGCLSDRIHLCLPAVALSFRSEPQLTPPDCGVRIYFDGITNCDKNRVGNSPLPP